MHQIELAAQLAFDPILFIGRNQEDDADRIRRLRAGIVRVRGWAETANQADTARFYSVIQLAVWWEYIDFLVTQSQAHLF
ncbi:hypothetical protein D3C76_1771660 [compost metagenome]